MAGWVAGSNGNNANSASVEVEVEVEVEAELGKKSVLSCFICDPRAEIWPFLGNFLCIIGRILKVFVVHVLIT